MNKIIYNAQSADEVVEHIAINTLGQEYYDDMLKHKDRIENGYIFTFNYDNGESYTGHTAGTSFNEVIINELIGNYNKMKKEVKQDKRVNFIVGMIIAMILMVFGRIILLM